jgi:hypothetical protein
MALVDVVGLAGVWWFFSAHSAHTAALFFFFSWVGEKLHSG